LGNFYSPLTNTMFEKMDVYLFISLVAIYINVFFDFDWSFLGVFLLTLLFSVFLIRKSSYQYETKENIKVSDGMKLVTFFRLIYFLSVFFLCTIYVLIFTSKVLLVIGKKDQALAFFPYYQGDMKKFAVSPGLSEENKKRLFKIYQHSPSYYETELGEKYISEYGLMNLHKINPWHYYNSSILTAMYDKDQKGAEEIITRLHTDFLASKEENSSGMHFINEEIAKLANKIGDEYFINKNISQAVKFYMIALDFDHFVWNNTFPAFVYFDLNAEEKSEFWSQMKHVSGDLFYEHQEKVAEEHLGLFKYEYSNGNWDVLPSLLNRVDEIAPWVREKYVIENKALIQLKANEFIQENDTSNAKNFLRFLSDARNLYWGKLQIANYYMEQGDTFGAKREFQRCLDSWSKYNKGDQHIDCQKALEAININQNFESDYATVSKIIVDSL
jgi:hypothetical protein